MPHPIVSNQPTPLGTTTRLCRGPEKRRGALALSLGVVAALAFGPARAHAHLGHRILSAERYLKLDVAGHHARVVVSLTLGAGEGRRVLEAADDDDDGEVTATERDAYLARWGEGLVDEVPIFVDGERQSDARWTDGWMDPIGPVRRAPMTVEMVAHVELEGGEQTLRFDDAMVRREVFDRTDVAFRARDEAELLASGEGPEPATVIPDLAYLADHSPNAPVRLTARLRTPERSAADSLRALSSTHAAALGGAIVVVVLLGALWVRRSGRQRDGSAGG